jgi:probable F420-dependent oxidoreductase
MGSQSHLGITIPLENVPLDRHTDVLREAESLGYTDAWTSEVDGLDGFTPLALAATVTERMRLGVAIASVFTRGPALIAMTAAAMGELAPGRFCLGLGSSSNVIVEQWNSERFEQPLARLRDVTRVVRKMLQGEKVQEDLETIRVQGFRLSRPVRSAIPIFLAGLRPRALHLAGELGDGVLLNWLSPDDVPTVRAEVEKGVAASGQQKHIEVACRVFVCVGADREMAEQAARRYLAAYVTVPVYEKFHRWLGRGDLLAPMLAAWREGRRREAVQLVPEEVVRNLVLYGAVEDCWARLERYHAAGVDTIILAFVPTAAEPEERMRQCIQAIRDFAPQSRVTDAVS